MKYIDAEKLIALIDAKLEDLGMSGSVWVGRSVLQELKNDIITSLQQEQSEVDLEKKIMEKTSLEYKVEFWSECKGTKQPTIRKCNGCPMFTVHNEKPTCLYGR